MIFFGETSARRAVREYLEHYHRERNDQGLNNSLIGSDDRVGRITGEVRCAERLSGLLRYYYRGAA